MLYHDRLSVVSDSRVSMRRILTWLGTGTTFAAVASPVLLAQVPPSTTAFVDVAVVPMDRERVLAHQTVLVRHGRIVALGPVRHIAVPAGARRIDGRGKYLMPGLGDMHVHGTAPDRVRLLRYLAHGVTTIRDMYTSINRVETPALAAKRAVARGELLGPHIYTAERFATFSSGASDSTLVMTPLARIDSAALAAAVPYVVALKWAGHDFVKLYDLPHPVYDSIVAAAKRVGLRVAGHVPAIGHPEDVGLERVLHDRWASIEHGTGYFGYMTGGFPEILPVGVQHKRPDLLAALDTAEWMRPDYTWDTTKIRQIAIATREAGVWNCPTLRLWRILADNALRPESKLNQTMTEAQQQWLIRWVDLLYKTMRALEDVGAGLLLGTDDAEGGQYVATELEVLVAKVGLTPYQALATGTRNIATFLGTLDSMGTVGVGKRADLILLDSNPLRDVRAVQSRVGVMMGGQWLSRAEIDARLKDPE